MKRKTDKAPADCKLLERATPYPWRRNYKGDLCGAAGQPIYFHGIDAVLVEHAPLMMETLALVSRAALLNTSDPARALRRIRRLAEDLISKMETAGHDQQWCQGTID